MFAIPRGPFELSAAKSFLEGFTPADQPATDGEDLVVAVLGDDWQPLLARVTQTPTEVLVDVEGDSDPQLARAQIERMLSLDIDGSTFPAVGERDPIVGELQQRYRGLRPVLFPTPYEAACWAVLSQRTRMSHAAGVRRQLAERHGAVLTTAGTMYRAFPSPTVLIDLRQVAGISAQKLSRLHAVAATALDGALDATLLRRLEPHDALERLQTIHGIGPFGADLVLARGAGAPDLFPERERRLHDAMARLYDLQRPSLEDLRTIAHTWRPFRTWTALLLRRWYEDQR